MRTFLKGDGAAGRFWYAERDGRSLLVTSGVVGTAGEAKREDFADEAAAGVELERLVAEQVKEGYRETTAKVASSSLRASLEAALVENPDDLAAHSAYADYLAEQGDPRGELIQTQLALEDPARPAAERKTLARREAELLTLHGRQWLGATGRFLWGEWSGPDKPWRYTLRRGWLDTVRLLSGPQEAIEVLAKAPEARLLSRLEIVYDMRHHPWAFDDWVEGPARALGVAEGGAYSQWYDVLQDVDPITPLLASPYLGNLRAFKYGYSDDDPDELRHSSMARPFDDVIAEQVIALLEKCPRLEELSINDSVIDVAQLFASPALGQVRVLQYYFAIGRYGTPGPEYPLSALSRNASLTNLHTLRLLPGRDAEVTLPELGAVLRSPHLPALEGLQVRLTRDGDGLARLIAGSGVLRRLKRLDVAQGNMTDEGARLLADAEGVGGLEVLDVSRNALTRDGVAALERAGVRTVVAERQHGPDDDDYYWVDAE